MDILDIILAKKLTPQGQIETYAATAQQAVVNANQAVAAIESAASDIESAQAAATALLEDAQDALETVQQAQLTLPESYSTTGQNTDGYMTQKAVTDALAEKADTTTLNNYATTVYVNQQIASIPAGSGSGGNTNLGANNAGKIVIVGQDGYIIPGTTSEETLIEALIRSGAYNAEGTLGLSIDYQNKNFERTQDAVNLNAGADFNIYSMYGGRMRCNVADDGTINAFYGDPTYTEDGSNGQVMVYQPKFYYQRLFLEEEKTARGTIVRRESLLLSPIMRNGFKLHPLFINSSNEELDYVLLSAYEGNIFDTSENTYITDDGNFNSGEDKLSSIAGVKPVSGIGKNITFNALKAVASNRGVGWQVTDMKFESALQMLMTVEYGTMNGQYGLGKGIVNITDSVSKGGAITGSTSNLGNTSGVANFTIFDNNGNRMTKTDEDTCAISYRGMENPWGNLWRIIGDCTIKGDSNSLGGIPYLNGTISLDFKLPSGVSNWISNMGYENKNYDWIYLPIECSSGANSALPVGDMLWTASNLNGERLLAFGGYFKVGDNGGLFSYNTEASTGANINYSNARLMFIPTKNEIYNSNITKWQQKYGG